MQKKRKKKAKLHHSRNRHLPIEEKVVTKQNQEEWAELRKDYDLYRSDCLIPTANHTWTTYKKLYATYETYCKALGIPVRISYQKLGTLLRENFMFSHTSGFRYGCIVKDELFVKEEDEVQIQGG